MTDWIANLKPGDKVITRRMESSAPERHYISHVQRVTNTQIVMTDGRRYKKRDGQGIPKVPYTINKISGVFTEKRGAEIKECQRRELLVRRIAAVTEEKLLERSTEQLEQIYKLIKGESE